MQTQTPDRVTASVKEVAALFGVSQELIYKLADSGKLATIRLGRRRMIPLDEVERLRNSRETRTVR